jgi:transposase
VYRQLTGMGIACEVVAPALIPVKAADRVKTDRRDATKLARLYRAGELTTILVPSSEQEAVRDVVRAREDVRKDLISARHRLSKFLIRHGRVFSDGKKWTQRFWTWLRRQEFERAAERITFDHYVLEVEHLVERKAMLEKEIHAIAAVEPYADAVGKLACLRG